MLLSLNAKEELKLAYYPCLVHRLYARVPVENLSGNLQLATSVQLTNNIL